MKRTVISLFMAALVTGCATPQQGGPSPEHGFNTFGQGLGHLILSPFMIVAGLLEGVSTVPYFVSADLHEMNRAMVEANAQVDLERTYQYAYKEKIEDVPASGDTGKIFRHLSAATEHFQRVLKGYGVEEYDRYILTGIRTADRDGYTLYAVVYRPEIVVQVREGGATRSLKPGDFDYYKPILRDANGRPMDVIIDWAGVPRTTIRTQKGQAILMTIAANSVLVNRRSDDYWAVEERWVAGEYKEIVAERKRYLDTRMGVST
ncbi:MAG: hypothetical protein OER43_11695 [Gammaproteobacteria bacterium]|nr:hypothetical protein [Gammaproteobacteria bacterium]MDH3411620.1 hypothetical protein [Gammaproteobacteria bacterium]